MKLCRYRWADLDAPTRAAALARPATDNSATITETVARIIAAVRTGGDEALRELTQQFDGVAIDSLRVDPVEIERSADALTTLQREAIEQAVSNIRAFHHAQQREPVAVTTVAGVRCERLVQPLDAVGLYVPAGSAPLPSAAMMLGVPAAIAGCPVRILCTPPGKDGRVDPAILYAARTAGVDTVFRVGGAQAIAAMAYGTESIPRVAKVFGPGNAWVTAAKTQVAADPNGAALDLPAGPSEVLVIADDTAEPAFVASDLLSQAEHGPDSQTVLLTPSAALVEATADALEAQLACLPRRDITAAALEHSALIEVTDLDEAVEISNAYAPEHLILNVRSPRGWLPRVRNAGSVFLGPWTPESLGDYCSGTNHVLPTYGYARNYSGLGLEQFQRTTTVQEATAAGLQVLGPIAQTLAKLEGLDAHERAVGVRLEHLHGAA